VIVFADTSEQAAERLRVERELEFDCLLAAEQLRIVVRYLQL
jgi:hypothetical protein